MKNFLRFTLVLVLCTAAPVATIVRAADEEAAAAATPDHPMLDELGKKLDLTDDQKAKIVPIVEKEMADLKALQSDTSMRRMQKLKKFRDISSGASAQIRALLTPAQQVKYDELRAEMQAKLKEKMKAKRNP